jgi:Skp family chaperone for outer membrane proteins
MKSFLAAVVPSLVLVTAPSFAQAPAGAPPAAPAPQTAPAAPAAPQPPRPFPEGAKLAYLNVQRIAAESAEGKASTAKVQTLNEKKVAELNQKNQALTTAQQKLQQSGAVMNDAARLQLEKDIEKMQVDIQRFTQDAQAEVRDLQESLQEDFQRKLLPIIQQVAAEKGLHFILSAQDAGIVWADPGLDVTVDVIKRFDTANPAPAAAAPAPAPKAPAAPAAPAPKK